LALTFSFGEKVSKKNFAFVKSIFEEHRFDGSPNLCKHKFIIFRLPSGLSFSADVVGDDALHRPVLFTLATSSQGILHEFSVPLTLGPSFSVRPENEAKDAIKSTYGSLDNHSLMPTHSQYDKHKRIFELLTLSTCKNAFHSLRQYLEYYFILGYTSRVLFYSRLYCSLANQFKFNMCFTYCSLEYYKV